MRARQQELFPDSLSHFVDNKLLSFPDDLPAIAMEMIPKENDISRLTSKKGSMTPTQFYDALIKHFETLVVAHSLGISVNDKKYGDMYYFPDTGRYVVLDWNVTHNFSEKEHGARADLGNGLQMFEELSSSAQRDLGWSDKITVKIQSLQDYMRRNHPNQVTALEIMEKLKEDMAYSP